MKRLFILYLLTTVFAQVSIGQIQKPITKGCLLSGGSLSFDIDKATDYQQTPGQQKIITIKTKSLQTDIYLGYFVFNNLACGVKTNILVSSEIRTIDLDPSYKLKMNNSYIMLGPFIRYSSQLGIFVEGSAGIALYKFSSNYTNSKYKDYSLNLGLGYSIFLTNSVAIEPIIRYSYLFRPSKQFVADREIKNGLTAGIGCQIYFVPIKNKAQN